LPPRFRSRPRSPHRLLSSNSEPLAARRFSRRANPNARGVRVLSSRGTSNGCQRRHRGQAAHKSAAWFTDGAFCNLSLTRKWCESSPRLRPKVAAIREARTTPVRSITPGGKASARLSQPSACGFATPRFVLGEIADFPGRRSRTSVTTKGTPLSGRWQPSRQKRRLG
jgi:hypothetical protein